MAKVVGGPLLPHPYRGWESSELQYYWQNMNLKTLPRDGQWAEKSFAEALERAGQGDEQARHHLRRIITRDPTTEQAGGARRALGE